MFFFVCYRWPKGSMASPDFSTVSNNIGVSFQLNEPQRNPKFLRSSSMVG
jgi:hypothetical protein